MAGKSGHTFTWKIENASYFWMKTGQYLKSPNWVVEELDCTSWSLRLYPRGNSESDVLTLAIERHLNCEGPARIAVDYQIAFLDIDGNVAENEIGSLDFIAGVFVGSCEVSRNAVFCGKNSEFLCNDTLTVICRLSKKSDVFVENAYAIARTTIKVEKRSCLLVVEDLAKKLMNKHAKFDISYGKNKFIRATFFLTGDSKEICNFEIEYLNKDFKYIVMKTFILNSEHKLFSCGESVKFGFGEKEKTSNFTLPMSKDFLMAKENNLLPNGTLYFRFQCSYTTGISFHEIGEAGVAYIDSSMEDHIASSVEKSIVKVFSSSMKNDLIPYDSCDAEIHTAGGIFVAHKNILSANSSVFRDAIQFDVSLGERAILDCSYVESETMSQLLGFIYTNTLGDLQWNAASKLYEAGCELDVVTLKMACASFFKNNICTHDASELLILADKYQDENLKSFLEKYISGHLQNVWASDK